MLPRPAIDNVLNGTPGESEFSGEISDCLTIGVPRPNLSHEVFREAAPRMGFATSGQSRIDAQRMVGADGAGPCLWVQSSPAPVAARNSVGLGFGSVAPSAGEEFRISPRPVVVTARQLGCLGSRPVAISVGQPSFGNCVVGVVGRRTEKQVCRIDAGRIVAVVAHKHPGRNGAIRQLPGDAMGSPLGSINRNPAVAVLVAGPRPQPATGRLLNPTPEPLFVRASHGRESYHTDVLRCS